MSLEKRFCLSIKDLPKNETYLAGISGGRDSIVLLSLLRSQNFKNLIICHLNHGSRDTSERDEEFCQSIARLLNITFISDKISGGKIHSEEAWRMARLEFFARVSSETGAVGLFLGHHADDLAETFLWNLLRGSGTAGLSPMNFETNFKTSTGNVRILRPLLSIWRKEIDDYAAANSLTFVEDESNESTKFTRNLLRHEIIPDLEKKLGRNIRRSLQRTTMILREENRYLDDQAELPQKPESLQVAWLSSKPPALQRRIILKWLQLWQVADVGFEEVESIRGLLEMKSQSARVNLPKNRRVRRRSGVIFLDYQTK